MFSKPCANYKVAYHQDDILDIKSKMNSGTATFTDADIEITGHCGEAIRIAFTDIRLVKMFRLFGLGRMIRIEHTQGTLFITVTRLNVFGFFISVNFLRTGELFKRLRSSALSAAFEDVTQDSLEMEFQQMEHNAKEKTDI